MTGANRDLELEKSLAAEAAARLVPDGAAVGLGTGSTVAHLLPLLAARALGLTIEPLDRLGALDIAIDGADQVSPDGWLVKGGGGAHTREKIVAAAARRFVVIVSSDKPVERLRPPVPLEILGFGAAATLAALAPARLRDVMPSPDGNLIADYLGPVDDPEALAARLAATPGVVEHGLFPPELVDDVIVARGGKVEWLKRGRRA